MSGPDALAQDPCRVAEFHEANYARVENDVKVALRRSGCILPAAVIEALTCTVLEEALEARRRMAFMVHAFNAEFGSEVTPERLERLETVLLVHFRDEHNMAYMPEPPEWNT